MKNSKFWWFAAICIVALTFIFWRRSSHRNLSPVIENAFDSPIKLEARVKYATCPDSIKLLEHMKLVTTQEEVTFLVNKGVTKQQLTSAMDTLSQLDRNSVV